MTSYFIRRFLLIIPTFLGITILVFTITRFVPGGPIERMIMQMQMASMTGEGAMRGSNDKVSKVPLSDEQLKELEAYYGFDKPVVVSYFIWLKKIVWDFDLGNSSRYSDPVIDIIKERLPVSIFYGLITFFLTYTICVPLGAIKAIKHTTIIDNLSSILIFIGYAIPNFVVGLILLMYFAAKFDWFPLGGFTSDNFDEMNGWQQVKDVLWHGFLPICAYMAGSLAVTTMIVKNSLMDHLASDFMRTALAKGLGFKEAVVKHAFRNSMIPLATSFGNNIMLILTGSFLIEKIFNINGIGLLGYESIVDRDYPVVMGILVISSLLFLIGNILSDVCVALVDPRIKFK